MSTMLQTRPEVSRSRFPDAHYFMITDCGHQKVVFVYQQSVGYAGRMTDMPMCAETDDYSFCYPLNPNDMNPVDLGSYRDYTQHKDNVYFFERFLVDCDLRLSSLEMIRAIYIAKQTSESGGVVDYDLIAGVVKEKTYSQSDIVSLFE